MLVRFNKTTIIAGTTYAKDAEADIANDLADQVVSDGNGVVVGLGARSNEVYTQTNPDGSTGLVVAGGGVIYAQPARPAITTEWTKLASATDLDGWTVSAEIASANKVNKIFRREGAALEIVGSAMSQEYGNLSKTALSWDLSAGGVIALLVYIDNLSDTLTNIRMYVGTSYNDCRWVSWTKGDGQLQEGWNVLYIHTSEHNDFFPTQNPANVTGWAARVAGVNQAAPQAVGVGHDFANTVTYARLEFNQFKAAATNVYVEGLYFGGFETPTLTIGYDIQGDNLDVYTKPAMDANGFTGYLAVPTANADPANPEYRWTADEIARMRDYHDDGWDIIPHSVSHNSLSTIEDAQRIADEYESCRQQLERIGCWRGSNMFVAPNNASDNRSVFELSQRGCIWQRASARVIEINSLVGTPNPLILGSLSGGGKTLAYLTNAIDALIMYGGSANFFAHEVYGLLTGHATDGDGTDYPSASQMYKYTLEQFLAYVKAKQDAGLLRVLTPTQHINALPSISPRNLLNVPSSISITPGTSPWTWTNRSSSAVRLLVSGGTVSAIDFAMDGTTFTGTGQTAGIFIAQPGEAVKVTYSVAPTVVRQRVSL